MPIVFEGRHLGELHVPPGSDQEHLARALRQLVTPPEWAQLGADLAALGPQRLAIAARAATAAAGGGRGVSADEEERIAQWFGGIVDNAIRRGGLAAAAAIWGVLVGDSHANSFDGRPARCPWVAEVPHPPTDFAFERAEPSELGRPGDTSPDPDEVAAFLAKLRAAAPGYVHTAIACASDADLRELRKIMLADDQEIEELRPWGVDLAAAVPASEALANARAMLTYRARSTTKVCSGFAAWAHGCAGMVAAHALSPGLRIGAVAWLARVALQLTADAAPSGVRSEGEAPRVELPPEPPQSTEQAAQDPYARSLVRNVVALEATGWHVIELRPSRAGAVVLWRVTIERYDKAMIMTLPHAADPDSAVAELVGYVQVDAR